MLGADFYGNDSFKIKIGEYGTSDKKNYLRIDFEANSMTYQGGGYVKDTSSTYKYSKAIEFVNINNFDKLDGSKSLNLSVDSGLNDDIYYIFYNEPGEF